MGYNFAMRGTSRLVLLGRVVKKPVYRETGAGGRALFYVEVDLEDLADRFLCVARGRVADRVMERLARGVGVCVEGTMRSVRVRSIKKHVRVYYVDVRRFQVLPDVPESLGVHMLS